LKTLLQIVAALLFTPTSVFCAGQKNLHPPITLQRGGVIPTNTATFNAYALGVLLSNANSVAEQWRLDISFPVTTNQITRLVANPATNGLSGSIQIDGKYGFGVSDGRFYSFSDGRHYSQSFIYSDEKKDSLASMTNLLTLETAVAMAQDKLHKLGIGEQKFGLGKPGTIAQWKYESNNVIYPLPLYVVRWQTTSGDYFVIEMEISGVTSNVAKLHFNLPAERLPQSLRVPTPTNYFQMLGLPPNIKFVHHDNERRERWKHQAQPEPLPLLN